MEKRYQVFVSSTYADLQEERSRVIQTLMEMDCIPAGMELFPAVDEEQFEFIKRVIDDCDYYIVIVGGRYGSVTADGVSYTEKEYDYARESGLKVIAFLHEDPEQIPVAKSETDLEARLRLRAFREKLASNRLVKFWARPEDLPGLVALSLSKTSKTFPAIGWVRANAIASEKILEELNELRKENAALRTNLDATKNSELKVKGLADLDETFMVHCVSMSGDWASTASWAEMFSSIAPSLLEDPKAEEVKAKVIRFLMRKEERNEVSFDTIRQEDFETITLQLKALDLVNVKRGVWSLTPAGERLMLELRTIRSRKDPRPPLV